MSEGTVTTAAPTKARKVEPDPARRRRHMRLMLGLTAVYLVFELAFNASLLDTAGTLVSEDRISDIEKTGRILSGIAVALLVWSSRILPRARKRGSGRLVTATKMAVSGAVCIGAMYAAQEFIIETLVDQAEGERRKAAAHLVLMSHAVHNGDLKVDGIDLSQQQLQQPEGKAFMALFPALALSTGNLENKAEAVLSAVVENAVVTRVNGQSGYYNDVYLPSLKRLKESYNAYVDGSNRYADAIASIPRRQRDGWSDFIENLPGDRYKYRGRYRIKVRDRVRSEGVPVPDDWEVYDQQGFYRAVERGVMQEADARFKRAIYSEFDGRTSIRPGLSWPKFAAHPDVQSKWRDMMDLPDGIRIPVDAGFPKFISAVFDPFVAEQAKKQLAIYRSSTTDYAVGGKHEEAGEAAIRAAIVPPIAFFFSILGALVHVFKTSVFAIKVGVSTQKERGLLVAVVGAFVLVVSLYPIATPNSITLSRVFSYFEEQTTANVGGYAAGSMRWVIQAQPVFYPVTDFVRSYVLMGFDFNYDTMREPYESLKSYQ